MSFSLFTHVCVTFMSFFKFVCLYVNMYDWLHVSLFSITFLHSCVFVSLLTRLYVTLHVWVFDCL